MADNGQQNFMMQMLLGGMYGPNQFSKFPGGLQQPGYVGTPTDAQGNPIQSFLDAQKAHDAWNAANPTPAAPAPALGTTLNSTPNQAPQFAGYMNGANPQIPTAQSFGGSQYAGSQYGGPPAVFMPARQQQQAAPAAPAAPTNPIDMRQAYLDALSNPGHVTTPGANIPPTTPVGNQVPSVMSQFLANQGGKPTSGAGGYSNQNFFDTLNALRR